MSKLRFNKLLSGVLVMCMFVSIFAGTVFAQNISSNSSNIFIDVSSDFWASKPIMKWSSSGLITGYDRKFRPNDPITRAEFAAIINKCMIYPTGTKSFTDVSSKDWFAGAISAVINANVMDATDREALPKEKVTREAAAVMFARAFSIGEANTLSSFSDYSNISKDAVGYVSALTSAGIISGKPGNTFDPKGILTRAEVVSILEKIAPDFIGKAGTYSLDVAGNVLVNSPDVTLKDMNIKGNLYLAPGIGNGDFHANNVKVSGKVIAQGGGKNSVYFANVSVEGGLVVTKQDGNIRIVASGTTEITTTVLESGAILVTQELVGGGFKEVTIPADVTAGQNIEMQGNFTKINNSSSSTPITIKGTVSTFTNNAEGAKIDIKGSVTNMNFQKGATITGDVTITNTVVADNVKAQVNGKTVVSTPTGNTGGSTSGSNGGNSGGSNAGNNGGNTTPSDTTAPTVALVAPTSCVTGAAIILKCSEAVKGDIQNLVTLKSIESTSPGAIRSTSSGAISFTVTHNVNDSVITIQPSVALIEGTVYIVTIGAGITDLAGNALIIPSSDALTFTAPSIASGLNIQNISGTDLKSIPLTVNENASIKAIVVPYQSVNWSSDDASIVTVTANLDGTALLTAVKAGSTKIRVTTSDNKYTSYIDVTVNDPKTPDPVNAPKFLSGYPFINLDSIGFIVLNLKTLTDADVYIVKGYGDEKDPASELDVLHGHRANQVPANSYLIHTTANSVLSLKTYDKLTAGMPTCQYFFVATVKDDKSKASNVKIINITNELQSTMDTQGPTIRNAYINADRTKVTIMASESLDESSVPDISSFSVDGLVPKSILLKSHKPSFSSHTLSSGFILSFDTPLAGSGDVEVSYKKPELNPIQDTSKNHNKADDFSITTETAALNICNAIYNANTGELDVMFDNFFDVWGEADFNSLKNSFTLKNGKENIPIKQIYTTSFYDNSGSITLLMECEAISSIADGSKLTLTYTKPVTGGLKNNSGDCIESITNEVTVSKTGPVLQSAEYTSYNDPVEGDYDNMTGCITLTFDKPISQNEVANCSFTITVDGKAIPSILTRVRTPWMGDYRNGDDNKLRVYIYNPYITITKSSKIDISYSPLHKGDQDTIRDASGNAVTIPIEAVPVKNNSQLQ